MIDFRLGRYQDVLQDVECDALICDPPYSERTHKGALDAGTLEAGVSGYGHWTPDDAEAFIKHWHERTRGWMVIHNDDVLAPHIRAAMEDCGRYTFTTIPVLQHQPRVSGDGPAGCGHFLIVSRPKKREYMGCGSLPAWYGPYQRGGGEVRGAKHIELMKSIVRGYSKPNDLICDPCAGGATTLIAAASQGRRSVGSEMDADTYAKAKTRIDAGYTTDMFAA